MIPLSSYLIVAALMFSIGLLGVLTRRNAILLLVSIELMMNAANLNFIAFWRYGSVDVSAQIFALFSIVIAGAESAVGLALVIAIYRHMKSVNVEELKSLHG